MTQMVASVTGYRFREKLLELERVSEGELSVPIPGTEEIVTPLDWKVWEEELEMHPDREWVKFLVKGIKEGFRLGHEQRNVQLRSRTKWGDSSAEVKEAVSEYLAEEVKAKRVWRVGKEEWKSRVQCSPLTVIPKKGKPGRWRLIVNLSAPEGHSVNDGISRELASVHYATVDVVVERVIYLGAGAQMAKADMKAAYRNIPVHPKDRWLLGMEWEGSVFVDGALPFGLRSAPIVFTTVGDAIEWIAKRKGAMWLEHYLDDYVTVGSAGTSECASSLKAFKDSCERLGMPLDPGKEEGPAEVITFLGMELDSRNMVVKLPEDKLRGLRKKLGEWRGMKSCRKRDLLSILGHLDHACKAVRAGRSFTRRLRDLSMTVKRLDRRVRLNVAARADLEWWRQFGLQWNGVSMMRALVEAEEPQVVLVSDASGSWGCGAAWEDRWFQLSWSLTNEVCDWGIMPKEMLPIVIAAAVWGYRWRGLTVKARCDNVAVVATVRSGSCKERHTMHLRRCLAYLEAVGEFVLVADHIRGVDNVVADALSRDNVALAHSLMQEVREDAEVIPPNLLELLTTSDAVWSEREWSVLHGFTSHRV